ncbi:NlpC/P60 family protein [Micromonospora phaseoli]|uniref:NlpC/P60 family protein n=1 Tax=Micromonospora phaseoli TaxID=1144548 RepID=A0A1H7D8J7_9ACTN|nr:NlpC/P60 family protein [Micromonospora phaseoli]PZV90885.1 NlpC/P60 family protein [Micromonospora phaseoli]GIJ77446.1 peptidase P60 [Micromonospora phaseoli]SEJ98179.1 NlpC/P60 family protein [Micromonospora phaseoli]
MQQGVEAVVRVAIAALWSSPDAVRPVDAPALRSPADVGAWVAGMDADQQVGDGVLSQLLLGERVLVTEIRPDGWAHVVAVEQPAPRLDPRGYPGWLPVTQLTPAVAGTDTSPRVVVDATVTSLHHTAFGAVALPGVVLGTRLVPAGDAIDGWRPVHAPGRTAPLWLTATDTVPEPTAPPTAEQVLAVAARLVEVGYLWGGLSAYGIDCSGLVHLVWRRLGVLLPRDSGDQVVAAHRVELGAERAGDLYSFARPGHRIHHIGIVTAAARAHGERRMLHACFSRRRVLEELLPAERTATLAGAHRVVELT